MIDGYKFNCETYFQENSQHVDVLFAFQESELTLRTVKMFNAQENQCNVHINDAVTVLSDVTLSASSCENIVLADEVQLIVERDLLAQQTKKFFSGNLNQECPR